MDSISIITRLTVEDWRAYQRAVVRRLRTEEPTRVALLRLGLALGLGLGVALVCDWLDAPLQLPGVLAGVVIVWVFAWVSMRLTRRYVPYDDAAFLGEHVYEIGADGFHVKLRDSTTFSSWSSVRQVSATPDHLFLWIDKFFGHVVPFRDVPADVARDELLRQLEGWVGSAVAPDDQWSVQGRSVPSREPGTAIPTTPGATEPVPTASRTGWAATLGRLLALRNAADAPTIASIRLLVLLAIVAIAVWVGISWLDNQPAPEFYVYGASDIPWYALMGLALAAFLAWRSVPSVGLFRALAIVLAAVPILIVSRYVIDTYLYEPWSTVATLAVFAYFTVYGMRSLRALSGRGQPVAIAGAAILALLMSWATQAVYVDTSLWMSSEDEGDGGEYDTAWKASEPLLFSQPSRIDAAIDKIAPASNGAPAAFFVGFAGYAEQRVFAEEIKLASRVIGRRYDTQDRSVLLVNDRRSLEAYPLASPTALQYTLQHLARKMDVDRDVLILALSSHGSVDTLSVSNGPMGLQDLTAAQLAKALQKSGIKWRVILISACHAGSFIDELEDPRTIVITAAASDKTSFGCSDERDLTYFGEAFYRDALPGAASLRAAFDKAKAKIAVREKRAEVTPSDPQASFGTEMERYLESFDDRAGARTR